MDNFIVTVQVNATYVLSVEAPDETQAGEAALDQVSFELPDDDAYTITSVVREGRQP